MIAMTAKTDFHNERIVKTDGTHGVKPGDAFETDWLHAKELHRGGLADPADPAALDKEPAEAVDPHHALSAPDRAAVNARRAQQRGAGDPTKAAAAALERVRSARAALVQAEAAAKDKPGAEADAKLSAAQKRYEEAEAAAKALAA